jgi:universal stress protein A
MILVSKILAPVDFSTGSDASVEYAVALAQTLHSAVTLFHVCQSSDLMESIVPEADSAVDTENDRTFAQHELEKIRSKIGKGTDVAMYVVVSRGAPAPTITSFSRKEGFDMVVIGAHGRTGLRRLLMGSVAEEVVRGARCPILTIHIPLPQ